mmetsp:Transcript_16962/g.40663  ORF Transcript_16962/g.40663 Transcript_16962/m.40663 type:complete len:387 (+) Transcript_16962:453-1613(+)
MRCHPQSVQSPRCRVLKRHLWVVRTAVLQQHPHPLDLDPEDLDCEHQQDWRVARLREREARAALRVGVAVGDLRHEAARALARHELNRLLPERLADCHRRLRRESQGLERDDWLLLHHLCRPCGVGGDGEVPAQRQCGGVGEPRRLGARLRPGAVPQLPHARHAQAHAVPLARHRPLRRDRVRRHPGHLRDLRVVHEDRAPPRRARGTRGPRLQPRVQPAAAGAGEQLVGQDGQALGRLRDQERDDDAAALLRRPRRHVPPRRQADRVVVPRWPHQHLERHRREPRRDYRGPARRGGGPQELGQEHLCGAGVGVLLLVDLVLDGRGAAAGGREHQVDLHLQRREEGVRRQVPDHGEPVARRRRGAAQQQEHDRGGPARRDRPRQRR